MMQSQPTSSKIFTNLLQMAKINIIKRRNKKKNQMKTIKLKKRNYFRL